MSTTQSTPDANTITLGRKHAAALIEEVRALAAKGDDATARALRSLLEMEYGQGGKQFPAIPNLTPCPGNAHSPEVGGMQDNCTCCMPRWGWVGPVVTVR